MNRPKIATLLAMIPVSLVLSAPASAQATKSKGSDASAAGLKQDMRKLWTDHVVWTRDYIIAAVGDQPDAQAAAGRLMKNQEDIGNAVGKYLRRAGRPAAHKAIEGPYF